MWWTDIIPMLIQRYSADNNDICIPKNNKIIQLIKLFIGWRHFQLFHRLILWFGMWFKYYLVQLLQIAIGLDTVFIE